MSKSDSGLYKYTAGANAAIVKELIATGEKCNPSDILGIFKCPNGRIVWLEKGCAEPRESGLVHILNAHGEQFKQKGILKAEIPHYIMEAVRQDNIVGYQGKRNPRTIFEFIYCGKKQRVAVQIASNGYIVSANPK